MLIEIPYSYSSDDYISKKNLFGSNIFSVT